jgi:hypothetical protein
MKRGGAKGVFRKEGGAFAPRFSLAGKTGNKIGGKIKNERRRFKNVNEETKERIYLD